MGESENNDVIYLIEKLSDCSGFFMTNGKLLYMVKNYEHETSLNLSTEFLQLNTNVEIISIESNKLFQSGTYNILEFHVVESDTSENDLETFINLCVAHTKYMHAREFVKFFHSLMEIFQYPREQQYLDLIGLYGELAFIRHVFKQSRLDISDKWHVDGTKSKYDISLDKFNIEIKTSLVNSEGILIKHTQLFNFDNNFLATVQLEELDRGQTLKQLISELLVAPEYCNNYSFLVNLEKEKKKISLHEAETRSFLVRDIKVFDAESIDFLGKIPLCISDLKYRMDLSDVNSVAITELFGKH